MPGSRPPSPPGPPGALQALLSEAAGDTLRRAQWLDSVDQLLRPHLPPPLAAHARLANVRDDRLVYVVDAPVWHAKLRLATQALVDAARSVGLDVAGISVRTTLLPLRPMAPAATRTSMSTATRPGLAAAMELLRSDAPSGAVGGDREAGSTGTKRPHRTGREAS